MTRGPGYARHVSDADAHTDDTPNMDPSNGPPRPPESAEQVTAPGGCGVEQLSFTAPNTSRCDYCGQLTTRPRRAGRDTVACSGRCRTNAYRWVRWYSVPAAPWRGSSLWARSPRKSPDDRPRVERRNLGSGVRQAETVSDLRALLRELADAATAALRDGPVTILWSVDRETVVRGTP